MLNPVIEQQLTMDAPFAWVIWNRAQLDNYYKDISKCSDDSDLKFSKIGAENNKNTNAPASPDIFKG